MGKLGWSPYDYYTSSLCEFYYACKGYFDKEKDQFTLMRNVALFASHLGSVAFNKAWPSEEQSRTVEIDPKWYKIMQEKHNFKPDARNKSNSGSKPTAGSKGT